MPCIDDLVLYVIQHPVDAEFVGELAVGAAPEALVQWHDNLAAGGELVEEAVYLFVGAAAEAEADRVAGFEMGASYV